MQKPKKQQNQPTKILPYQQSDTNRIFTTYKRGISSLSISLHPPKPKFHSREHNILLLKKTIKRNNRHEYQLSKQKINKSVDSINQRIPINKINVINIMNCSTGSTPKLKSSYCKKITLTNVEKYYQFCLRKVKDIADNDCSYLIRKNISQENTRLSKNNSEQIQVNQAVQSSARPETPSKISKSKQITPAQTQVVGSKQLVKSLSFNNCHNTFNKSTSLQNNKKQLQKFIQFECSNISKLYYKNPTKHKNNQKSKQQQLRGQQLIISPRLRLKQQIPRRNSKSSQYSREYDSRLSNTSEEKKKLENNRYRCDGKKQFIIDGWQAYENVIDEAF